MEFSFCVYISCGVCLTNNEVLVFLALHFFFFFYYPRDDVYEAQLEAIRW